jgi:hypothetical protein
MKRKIFFNLIIVAISVILAGCAVGNKHAYHNANIDFHNEGSFKVAVATHDQRSYIVSSDKEENFVGLQRGGYGNPFDVTTVSGKSLAEDFTYTIVNSLQSIGFDSIQVIVSPQEGRDDVIKKIKDKKVHRSILIILNEWKSDTYQNTALIYDVSLEVLDDSGQKIAEKRINGRDNLKGSFWDPPAHAKQAIPIAFKEKMELLLNSNEISEAGNVVTLIFKES